MTKANYKLGVLDGEYLRMHSDKTVAEKGNYINGKKNGLWLKYDRDGLLESEVEYENGNYSGINKTYIDGNLYMSEPYVFNKKEEIHLEYKVYTSNKSVLKSEKTYKNGKLDGTTKFFNERDGKLEFLCEYKEGILVKENKYNYQTGLLESESLYDNKNNLIARKIYERGKLKQLLLENEKGTLSVVREYNINTGKITKKSPIYKKPANLKLVEDQWGIIDIS